MSEDLEVKVGKFPSRNIWNRAVKFGKRSVFPLLFASLLGCSSGGGSSGSGGSSGGGGGSGGSGGSSGNHAPVIFSSAVTQVNENSPYSYDVNASDSDNDTIIYSLAQAPSWLSINSSTGLITGVAPEVGADSNHPVTVQVSDGKSFPLPQQQYTLTVKNVSSSPAQPSTKVLPDSTLATITFVETNAINFSQPVSNISINDIIVAGISAGTPYGYLAEVTGISSDRKTVFTKESSLERAASSASFSIRRTLLPSDATSLIALRGVSELNYFNSVSSLYNFNWVLNNVVIFDADENPATTNDQIVANGDISFSIDYDFDFNINNYHNDRTFFQTIADVQANLTLTSTLSGLVPRVNKEIGRHYFTPFIAGYTPTIPSIPVVIAPIARGFVCSSATGFQSQTSVNDNATLTAGIDYSDSVWTPISTFSNNFTFTPPTNPLANSDAKGCAGVSLGLYVMGLLGPYGQIDVTLKYTSDATTWSLNGGLEALLGVSTGIIGADILNYSNKVLDYERVLASGDFAPPTPPLSGKIAFARGNESSTDIYTMNPDGTNQINRTDGSPNPWNINPSWTPDGTKIVFASKIPFTTDDFDIYMMNADGSGKTPLITSSMNESSPVISPDGTRMAYKAGYSGRDQIYTVYFNDLAHPVERTSNYTRSYFDLSWTPDGNSLIFVSNKDNSRGEVYKMNLSTNIIYRLTEDSFFDSNPSVCSIDGKVAWSSNRSGNYEIWTMNTNGTDKVNVSNSPETFDKMPSWNFDCSKITYSSRSNVSSSSLANEIWIMNADGSNKTPLTGNSVDDSSPSWSR